MNAREYSIREKDDAARQIGRYEGKRDVFEEMAQRLDPEKYCQDCGEEYREPGSRWGKTKEEHLPLCEVRKNRIAAERKTYFDEFQAEKSNDLGKEQDNKDKPTGTPAAEA